VEELNIWTKEIKNNFPQAKIGVIMLGREINNDH
jgi:hypothetical protein